MNSNTKKKHKCEVCGQEYKTIDGLALHNHYSWKHNPELKPTKDYNNNNRRMR